MHTGNIVMHTICICISGTRFIHCHVQFAMAVYPDTLLCLRVCIPCTVIPILCIFVASDAKLHHFLMLGAEVSLSPVPILNSLLGNARTRRLHNCARLRPHFHLDSETP